MGLIINKGLIEAVNARGMVVRDEALLNESHESYGRYSRVIIEGSQYRITFITTALNKQPQNYFKILEVEDLIKKRKYTASRFHHKFISLIAGINGYTFIYNATCEVNNNEL